MPKRQLCVLLCHSSLDKPAVRKLYHRLRADGFAPWLDEEEASPGQDWPHEIPAAISASDIVIVCLSQKSASSDTYLQREVREVLYLAGKKPAGTIWVIPARLDEVEIPKHLSQWHWPNVSQEGSYQNLVWALNVHARAMGVTVASDEAGVPVEAPEPVATDEARAPVEALEADGTEEVRAPVEAPEPVATDEVRVPVEAPEAVATDEERVPVEAPEAVARDEVRAPVEAPQPVGTEEVRAPVEAPEAVATDEARVPVEAPEAVAREEVRAPVEAPEAVARDEVRAPVEAPDAVATDDERAPVEALELVATEEVRIPAEAPEAVAADEVRAPVEAPEAVGRDEVRAPVEAAEPVSAGPVERETRILLARTQLQTSSKGKGRQVVVVTLVCAAVVVIVGVLAWVYWPKPPRPQAGSGESLPARTEPVVVPQQAGPVSQTTGMQVRENAKDGLKYVWIPPGTFTMGCSPGDDGCRKNEKPPHTVKLSKGFWVGQTDVTVGAYQRYTEATGHQMPSGPNFQGAWVNSTMPIVYVSWIDANDYCTWAGGRLPTEAEWEYAARGGSAEPRYGNLDEIAWSTNNSGSHPHEVAQKRANGFGLYDMLGNVMEWVNDWYDQYYYLRSPSRDPLGPASGQLRVLRGGSWGILPRDVRMSARFRFAPADTFNDVGFRCLGGSG